VRTKIRNSEVFSSAAAMAAAAATYASALPPPRTRRRRVLPGQGRIWQRGGGRRVDLGVPPAARRGEIGEGRRRGGGEWGEIGFGCRSQAPRTRNRGDGTAVSERRKTSGFDVEACGGTGPGKDEHEPAHYFLALRRTRAKIRQVGKKQNFLIILQISKMHVRHSRI
jgi:hypothetical protein